jgi:hypothetical protein
VNGAVELLGYTSVDPSSRLVRCQARSQMYKSCSRAALLPSKVLRGAGDISSGNLVQPRTGAGGLIFFGKAGNCVEMPYRFVGPITSALSPLRHV